MDNDMIKIFPLLFMLLFSARSHSSTLLILGDSLSAGYQMPIAQSWPALLGEQLERLDNTTTVVSASISGDTTGNGLARLPALLAKHKPSTVLIELGANDGLRGFPIQTIRANLEQMITLIQSQNSDVLLLQIEIPRNYGKRYTQAFSSLYLQLSERHKVPLLPFFMIPLMQNPQLIMADGLHPTAQAQPWIAQFMAKQLLVHLK